MSHLNEPHGGVLVSRVVAAERAASLRERAAALPRIALDAREAVDLDLVASGAASPLTGFLGLRDYRSVLERLTLSDGTPWPVPFTLAVTIADLAKVLRRSAAALFHGSKLVGVLDVADAFVRNPREEAAALYGSNDASHPGVAYLLSRPTGILGGEVEVLPPDDAPRPSGAPDPREIRARALRERWTGLAGLASPDGRGCLEASSRTRGALLPMPRIALRHAPARDAMLQAIVFKNHGAREVFLEYDRAAVREMLHPTLEDVGVTPIWFVTAAGRATAPVRRNISGRPRASGSRVPLPAGRTVRRVIHA